MTYKLSDFKAIEERVKQNVEECKKYCPAWIPYYGNIHNYIERGKKLDPSVLDEIHDGNFDNAYVGDYFEVNGIKWTIKGFDRHCLKVKPPNETSMEEHVEI